ncbi:MAG: peptide deformylase [Candidatus Cryptobacteroides sp.]
MKPLIHFTICILAAMLLSYSCAEGPANQRAGKWSSEEKELIGNQAEGVMRVLTVADKDDSLFLRKKVKDLNAGMLAGEYYKTLAQRMIATVTSPEQDGVGIAGPQVGISRRIVAVQRFDKENEPFEVYPQIRITAVHGEKSPGREGCLSVPDMNGEVLRYRMIDISYISPETLRDTSETIEGFTAVIFQHECDHLEGVLYTDYLEGFGSK